MKQFFASVDAKLAKYARFSPLLLRMGLAIVFTYAAIASTLNPEDWVGFLPKFMTALIPAEALLKIFSIFELVLAVWLLSGVYVRYAALLCAATLVGIVVSNFSLFDISFRDIGLALAALALAFMTDQPEANASAR